ncbi:NCS1 family nucleobase:cation symporter-1 [Burkholderia orbicola]|uniref:NCS1 family nucleobase:cation symporter-1 n=1 Tax=Burkholderia orbicola TaxID=2978683 RepID=UPI0019065E5A|nr:NCS1 family nucleobase:cation symporter-1 [Burkholderia orbicola]MBK1819582.1 NCS1 family nucleobase:cation symporter-1 [Burkholderia orbicola]
MEGDNGVQLEAIHRAGLGLGADDASHRTDPAARDPALSPRLHNPDLAPTQAEGRTWGRYSIFALWTNDVHNIANYSFAIGLFALGLSGWQMLASLAIGAVLVYGFMNLTGYMGQKTGVPFPVISRMSFGIYGAMLPAMIRAVIAIAWFGIQTYLASVVLRVLLTAIWPGLAAFDQNAIFGLSTLGWITFVAIWLMQIGILTYGMEMVRKYEGLAGPVILVTTLSLAAWMFSRTGGHLAMSIGKPMTGLKMWTEIFAGGSLWLAIYGTLVLNFCDFARSSPSPKTVRVGNFWGLPVNILVFATISFVLAGAQFKLNGHIIHSPTEIIATVPNKLFLVLGCLAFLIVTVAVNIMANFVAPAFVLTSLAPHRLSFRRAGLISATIAVLILPWNLYNSPIVIVYFLSGLGALLGPLYGIITVDYWLVRKQRVNVPDLYTEAPSGAYFYTRGVNRKALAALVPSALISITLAVVPAFSAMTPFSWLLGAAIAGSVYWLLADRKRIYEARSGEHIAVACARH